jgi:magnesium transporter
MLGSALVPEIKEMIQKRDFVTLRDALEEMDPADVAEILTDLAPDDRAVVFRILHRPNAADIFEHLELEVQEEMLFAMASEDVAGILNEMAPDDRTALLEELPPAVTERLLNLLTAEQRKIASTLLGFPEGSIGRLMTTDYVRAKPEWTIAATLEHIRKFGRNKETIHNVYVSDLKGVLVDDIKLRELVLADPSQTIADLMDEQVTSINANDPQEEAVRAFEHYDRNVLPVVDSRGVLVGIVTVDDVLDVVMEEATEDIQKMGAVAALETPYIDATIRDLVQKRVGWLIVLFVGQTLTATVIQHFEASIQRAVVLSLFIPLIISSGGNTGSQAATLIIRAMSMGEITFADWWMVVRREFACGLMLGIILGAVGVANVLLWQAIHPGIYGEFYFAISMTVGLSLLGVVLWGSLIGSVLPLILKALKQDPAVASAPFVATMCDVTGLIIYFTAASLVLTGKLL